MSAAMLAATGTALQGIGGLFSAFKGGSNGVKQKDYKDAQQGTWEGKMEAAKKYGIHPLYMVGAPTVSPVGSFQARDPGEGIASAGRALTAFSQRRSVELAQAEQEARVGLIDTQQKGQSLENAMLALQLQGAQRALNKQPGVPEAAAQAAGKIYESWDTPYGKASVVDQRFELPESYGLGLQMIDPAKGPFELWFDQKRKGAWDQLRRWDRSIRGEKAQTGGTY